MSQYLGTYTCKVDAKGRMRIPSGLLSQIDEAERGEFVLNRDFEKCISFYTKTEWESVTTKINKLNTFVKKNRDFVRYFHRGANRVSADSMDRILITKLLLEYASIDKEVIVYAYMNKIEIWAKEEFERVMKEPIDFGNLAEDVMGDINEGI